MAPLETEAIREKTNRSVPLETAPARRSRNEGIVPDAFLSSTRDLIGASLRGTCFSDLGEDVISKLRGGKMLRTRLAMRLVDRTPCCVEQVRVAAAAVEMVHAASLLHDDVIDGGEVRRGAPAFWRRFGVSGAILAGDLLFCCSAEVFSRVTGGLDLLPRFVRKMRELCEAETEQEMFLRGRELGHDEWLDIARRKTGPLFAFVAEVCGGADPGLSAALEEAGYCIGTAYQIADDLIDVAGDSDAAGKTLGNDRLRGKSTIATRAREGLCAARDHVPALCASSLDSLRYWPDAHNAVADFLRCDMQPVLDSHIRNPELRVSVPG